jgi:hypothetical protein
LLLPARSTTIYNEHVGFSLARIYPADQEMTSITLNSDQLRQWQTAHDGVELVDQSGNVLGYVAKSVSADALAAAVERSKSEGPWHTTEEVLNHLNSLDK